MPKPRCTRIGSRSADGRDGAGMERRAYAPMMRASCWTTWAALGVAAALAAGCGMLTPVPPIPSECDIPPGTGVAFVGDATLGELGLAAPGGESLGARAWITDEPILFEPTGNVIRVICAELEDGTFMLSPYPPTSVPNEGG